MLRGCQTSDTTKLLSLCGLYLTDHGKIRRAGDTKTSTRDPCASWSLGRFLQRRRNQLAAASAPRQDSQNVWRFSLTKFGIPLLYVFRDKRVSRTQVAGVLPGLRVEPTLVRSMTKVGLRRVPERTVIFDSLVLSSRHDTDVPAAFGCGVINPTSEFKMW